ncbi:anti-sigma factor family protein [Rhizobium sp.]
MIDDQMMMAFADGEANEETTALVSRAMTTDPAIAERVAYFRVTRARTAEAMKPLIDQPVPTALALSVAAMIARHEEAEAVRPAAAAPGGAGNVVGFPPATARKRFFRPAPAWLMPIAAAIVLMVGGTGGYFLGARLPAHNPAEFASIDDPSIIKALSQTPSGQTVNLSATGRTLEPVVSFKLENGTFCREFKLKEGVAREVVSIACLEQDRWQTHLVMAGTDTEMSYVPAGSTETIDAYLSAIHAGAPLDGSSEEKVLRTIRQ